MGLVSHVKTFSVMAAAVVLGAAVIGPVARSQAPTPIAVVKDPGCGCCANWIAQLEKAGFRATVTESRNIDALKDSKGVPRSARSCHTGTVGGYVIEGHVPVADIRRLLKERPAGVAGLAVPGMPAGSPGMEVPGGQVDPYDTIAFDAAGKTPPCWGCPSSASPTAESGLKCCTGRRMNSSAWRCSRRRP